MFLQEAAALLDYCLADLDSPDVAAAEQLAGLQIVPLLSGGLAALQPARAGAPPVFLATEGQQRVLSAHAPMLLHCTVSLHAPQVQQYLICHVQLSLGLLSI